MKNGRSRAAGKLFATIKPPGLKPGGYVCFYDFTLRLLLALYHEAVQRATQMTKCSAIF